MTFEFPIHSSNAILVMLRISFTFSENSTVIVNGVVCELCARCCNRFSNCHKRLSARKRWWQQHMRLRTRNNFVQFMFHLFISICNHLQASPVHSQTNGQMGITHVSPLTFRTRCECDYVKFNGNGLIIVWVASVRHLQIFSPNRHECNSITAIESRSDRGM